MRSVCSVCKKFGQRPSSIADVVRMSMIVEAWVGLPLAFVWIGRTLWVVTGSAGSEARDVGVVVFVRVFLAFCSFTAVFLTSIIHWDVGVLLRDSARLGPPRLQLTAGQLQVLPRCRRLLLWVLGSLLVLRTVDISAAYLNCLPLGWFGQCLLVCFYCLLALNGLLMFISHAVFRWHERHCEIVSAAPKKGLVHVDLDSCSRRMDRASEEMCCICLCCLGEGEVVATLPCHHRFHRTCLERWRALGHSCPLRCPEGAASFSRGSASESCPEVPFEDELRQGSVMHVNV